MYLHLVYVIFITIHNEKKKVNFEEQNSCLNTKTAADQICVLIESELFPYVLRAWLFPSIIVIRSVDGFHSDVIKL